MDLLVKPAILAKPVQLENAETPAQLVQLVKLVPRAQLVLMAILVLPETRAQLVQEHCKVILVIPEKLATLVRLVRLAPLDFLEELATLEQLAQLAIQVCLVQQVLRV
jgi:hypothetical protein